MARVTQPFRNSFSGSVGSGLGSLFGGSGKQYYILEHKIGSKYHRAGESQEIIVDQVEIGRNPKCQVRFDESFTTVSRRHAAIVREGDRWKLVQLSDTNPTFLNGVPVKNEWYLQNGDEIQLAVGGPKLGFILPSGAKSTVGTIGLSRRLSLFRQQALKPYKQAMTLMGVALAVVVLAVAGWGYYSWQKQESLLAKNLELATALDENSKKSDELVGAVEQSAGEMEAQRQKTEALANELIQSNEQSAAYQRELDEMHRRVTSLARASASSGSSSNGSVGNSVNTGNNASGGNAIPSGESAGNSGNATPSGGGFGGATNVSENESVSGRGVSSVSDINDYIKYVFAIFLDKKEITVPGRRPVVIDIPLPKVVGTGFMLNDGRFVTARHVMEPWYFFEHIKDNPDLRQENQYACNGGAVVYYFTAISNSGQRFTFNSDLAKINRTTDKVESDRAGRSRIVVRKAVIDDTDWAYYQRNERTGFQFNNPLSTNLTIGAELEILGYPWGRGAESVEINPIYSTCNVARQGLDVNRTIMVSNDNTERGNAGGPVLIKNEGTYQIVGVMSGSTFAKGRIVPITAVQ